MEPLDCPNKRQSLNLLSLCISDYYAVCRLDCPCSNLYNNDFKQRLYFMTLSLHSTKKCYRELQCVVNGCCLSCVLHAYSTISAESFMRVTVDYGAVAQGLARHCTEKDLLVWCLQVHLFDSNLTITYQWEDMHIRRGSIAVRAKRYKDKSQVPLS